jgi:hypothetical protein
LLCFGPFVLEGLMDGFLFEDAFSFISVRKELPTHAEVHFIQPKKVSVREEGGALNFEG